MKNNYFLLNKEQQRTVLEQAAIRKILPKQAVEKDLWVTAILQIVFALPCSGTTKKGNPYDSGLPQYKINAH